jgi:hypothetical protein
VRAVIVSVGLAVLSHFASRFEQRARAECWWATRPESEIKKVTHRTALRPGWKDRPLQARIFYLVFRTLLAPGRPPCGIARSADSGAALFQVFACAAGKHQASGTVLAKEDRADLP